MTTIHYPVRPQCSTHRDEGPAFPGATVHRWWRCPEKSVAHLTAPDGKLNPGGYVCWQHGAAILGEFAVKLGEQWGAVRIVTEKEAT